MFKQEITYLDFNGMERKEDFYFHLSVPEVIRLEAEIGKPLDKYAADLAATNDVQNLIQFIERVVLSSYGKRTPDGKSFIKNKDLRSEFEHSQAYAELFEMLITVPGLPAKFGQGVVDNGKKKNQVQPQVVAEKVEQ